MVTQICINTSSHNKHYIHIFCSTQTYLQKGSSHELHTGGTLAVSKDECHIGVLAYVITFTAGTVCCETPCYNCTILYRKDRFFRKFQPKISAHY